jgi:hypothetical protein
VTESKPSALCLNVADDTNERHKRKKEKVSTFNFNCLGSKRKAGKVVICKLVLLPAVVKRA